MNRRRSGFTLIELLLAVAMTALIVGVAVAGFTTVSLAWQKGSAMADSIHHGDFVIDQLVMALRSAYHPDAKGTTGQYGFWIEDDGDGEEARDVISWVKLGPSLVGSDVSFAGSPHRVMFTVGEDMETGDEGALFRAWRLHGQEEEFDPENDVAPVILSRRVTGFNCRMVDPEGESEASMWLDEWEQTNRIPRAVELTLYLEPAVEGGDAVAIKRVFDVPGAEVSW
jgi:prepilin-type N-terminal cleavage/methylation domain-containing protein